MPIKRLSPAKKTKITDNKNIIASFRYQIVSIFTLMNRREDYMNFLKGRTDILSPPLKYCEIE
jgi:hypothetical protein